MRIQCHNIFERVKIAANKVQCTKRDFKDLLTDTVRENKEMIEHLKAIEEFEVQVNTARIACMYIKRRFNNNYLEALGTTQEVLEGKVAAPDKE